MYKILVVDDEKYSRDYISKYIKENMGEYFDVYSASDAKEALDILASVKTDIVITDIKMPGMSGIELAARISGMEASIHVIIMSAYDEFEYAKSAIRYGVREYFLKPFDLDEFYERLISIKNELDKTNKKNVFNYQGVESEARERFFINLVYGGASDADTVIKEGSGLGLHFNIEDAACDIIALKIDGYDKFLEEKWDHDKDSFTAAINNLVSGFMENEYAFCIHSENGYFEYIIYHRGTEINYSDIANKIYIILKLPVKIKKKGGTFYNIRELIDFCSAYSNIHEKAVLLSSYIKENNREGAENILKSLENKEDDLKNLFVEIGIPSQILINEKINYSGDITVLCGQVFGIVNKHAGSYVDSMERAKEFILKNYDKKISRDDVAKMICFSPSYFAKNFKQYTGKSFSDYLFGIRMEKAIELMKQNKYKIYEISAKVGYDNEKYFFRVFKMYTGYTPKEYIINVLGRNL